MKPKKDTGSGRVFLEAKKWIMQENAFHSNHKFSFVALIICEGIRKTPFLTSRLKHCLTKIQIWRNSGPTTIPHNYKKVSTTFNAPGIYKS